MALSRAEATRLRKLHRRRGREAAGLFLAEGVRVVADLLRSELPVRRAIVAPSLRTAPGGAELAAALEQACPVEEVGEAELSALAATETPQGVLAVAEIPSRELPVPAGDEAAVALVLDGVQDPGNVGTLIRTAEALGADFVAALPGTADPWNPKAVRAAAGSLFRIPVKAITWAALAGWLREHDFAVHAAEAGGSPVDQVATPHRAALVVGNEGAGIREEVRRSADALVSVPLRGAADSLNVAAAAAVLLYLLMAGKERR